MLFQPFKKATKAQGPELLRAAIAEAQAEQAKRGRRSQDLMGGAALYNVGMGDRSPIADYLFGEEGGGGQQAISEVLRGGVPQAAGQLAGGGGVEAMMSALPETDFLTGAVMNPEAGGGIMEMMSGMGGAGAGGGEVLGGLGTAGAASMLPPAALAYMMYNLLS